ncbi:putative transcription factor AP2-EREBP family [Helianthus annuus]|uniref:Putative DNA-binding domain-containing protein n=1 Tax=Helianthus annuus TaxID=4232 RepID=A0A251SM48_HELAN|nr:ethylene-responsive transcription factor ERF025 [Helianthus annuus]KAF5771333.1 putative transcription factor AP2-EREBP family [Helianthus annuus]KAJ0487748.1 putative transcription factor AP2-EREBP family [Helianthus annuus]
MSNRRRHSSEPSAAGGSSSRHPTYHGIRLRAGKWVSEIREPNKSTRIWLGTYPTPEMAAAAYDVAALALKGTYATLNFPESVISNTLPVCPTADDIRAAAARAAASKAPVYKTGGGSMSVNDIDGPRGFVDDDTLFDMPNLLSEMAQGMLLSPPRMNSSPPPEDGSYYYSGGGNLWDY